MVGCQYAPADLKQTGIGDGIPVGLVSLWDKQKQKASSEGDCLLSGNLAIACLDLVEKIKRNRLEREKRVR